MSQNILNEGNVSSHSILYEGDVLSQKFDIVALYATIIKIIELEKKQSMNLSIFWKMAAFTFNFVMNAKYCVRLFLDMMMRVLRLWFFYGISWMIWATN